MKIFFTIAAFLVLFEAQSQVFTQGARSTALGNVNSVFQDEQSLLGNQAGLGALKNYAVIAAAQRRFMLSELDAIAAGATLPTRSGTFGLLVQNFGYDEFRQQKIGLAYGRRLFEHFYAGASFDYFQTRIPEYGSKGTVSVQVGVQAELGKQVLIGAHIANPAKVEIADSDRLPTILNMGLAWTPSPKATLAFELEKDIDFPIRAKGGIEYRAAEPLFLRVGFASNPTTAHFGIGLLLKERIKVDVSSSYHQVLGFSPSFGVAYAWGKG
ncbi:MAG: hypothetical protein R2830_16565 [Saprospiraceae bacterium]